MTPEMLTLAAVLVLPYLFNAAYAVRVALR